ncbi:SPOR domain-containing protein [Comamonas sp. AG1104]|uniref:SPOR domain-containing protein n=1 Tax=Comamonas sp. AG1104 TaxID=2183900 RepID=UPI000E0A35B6|nr:SPOR domain-containing protein [Comamonas sp. AG1104]RDI08438.1 cell division septation protein DedD [Comamonas sp. AG1104]
MPSASDTPTPALAPAGRNQRQEPVLDQPARSDASPLPASIAGAFAAAAYSMQHSLQHEPGQSAAPEEEDSGLLPQLYASRLNPRSRDFYLAQFKRFDALDRSLPSWNMAAALLTLAWCSLHGLWREAAKYLAAVTATALIWWFGLRPALPEAMALGLGIALWLVAVAVPGLLGNGWYWRKIRAQTLQAITDAPNMAAAHAALQAQVGSPRNRTAAMLVLALPVAALAGAGLALLPAGNPVPPRSAEPAAITRPAADSASAPRPMASPAPAGPAAAAQPETRPPEPVPTAAAETDGSAGKAVPPAPAQVQDKTAAQAEPGAQPPAAPADKPAAKPAAEPKEQPVTAASQAASKAAPQAGSDLVPGKFYLNLGVYSEAGNADKVLAQLQKSRLPALTQKMSSNKGEVTRVRSGPFESRKRAEKAARKLQAANIEAGIFQSTDETHKP